MARWPSDEDLRRMAAQFTAPGEQVVVITGAMVDPPPGVVLPGRKSVAIVLTPTRILLIRIPLFRSVRMKAIDQSLDRSQVSISDVKSGRGWDRFRLHSNGESHIYRSPAWLRPKTRTLIGQLSGKETDVS